MTITPNHIAEALALATSITFWKSIKKSKLRSLPFFLLFILSVELLGNYLHQYKSYNKLLYNISIPIEYMFYLFLFYIHGKSFQKKVIPVISTIFLLIAIYYFLIKSPFKFHSYALVTGEVSVIICSCIYIYEEFQKNEEESLLKNYFFWLSSGWLLFNLGDLAYFLLYQPINLNNWDRFDFWFKKINNSLLFLLYLSYVISIIVYKKYRNADAGKC